MIAFSAGSEYIVVDLVVIVNVTWSVHIVCVCVDIVNAFRCGCVARV